MKNCQNCGKPIEIGMFCSKECKYAYDKEPKGAKPLEVNEIIQESKNNRDNYAGAFWIKGEGMNRRFHNIEIMEGLIKSGLTYQEIVRSARKNFTAKIIDEYYEIALDEVNNPIK